MDGSDICQELKSQEKTKHIPIIIVLANRDTEKIAIKASAIDFLEKSFDIDKLLAIVEKYIL